MLPQIVEKPALTAIGYDAAFISALSPDATNFKVIGPLWEKFIPQANRVPHRIGGEMYGIIYAGPETERAHPHEMQYLAGVPVSKTADIPPGMTTHSVAAGTFAVFIHRGPIKTIGDTIHEIYRVWLPQSGFRHAGVADVELYEQRFCHDGDGSEMEYRISVTQKIAGE
jgi:AraC family transcriptional regulator